MLRGQEKFRTEDHVDYMREGREEVRKRNTLRLEEAMVNTLAVAPVQVACRLWRTMKTGTWMTVQLPTANGMKLGLQD